MDGKTLLTIIGTILPCLFIIVLIVTAISSAIQSKRDKLSKDSPWYTSRFMVIPWCIFWLFIGYMNIFGSETIPFFSNASNVVSSKAIENENHIFVSVKYGNRIDVAKFDTVNTSKSSFIKSAYYDKKYQYLILNLNGTYYHRCDVPIYVWNDFKNSESFGSYYNKYIKGEYNCRNSVVPTY